MRGDESQAGVRGGVTQITPTEGQQGEFKVSHLNVCVCGRAQSLCKNDTP